MNYFFLFISIFCSVGLFAGSFGSKPLDLEEMKVAKAEKEIKGKQSQTIIQIVPIKGNTGNRDSFLKSQLTKIAIRHISLVDKYQFAFGKVLPKSKGNTQVENLEITLLRKGRRGHYRLELRVFELERDTLVKKVAQSKLTEAKLLQQAELMFQELFLEEAVVKDIVPE